MFKIFIIKVNYTWMALAFSFPVLITKIVKLEKQGEVM